jgi:hypothetical protein
MLRDYPSLLSVLLAIPIACINAPLAMGVALNGYMFALGLRVPLAAIACARNGCQFRGFIMGSGVFVFDVLWAMLIGYWSFLDYSYLMQDYFQWGYALLLLAACGQIMFASVGLSSIHYVTGSILPEEPLGPTQFLRSGDSLPNVSAVVNRLVSVMYSFYLLRLNSAIAVIICLYRSVHGEKFEGIAWFSFVTHLLAALILFSWRVYRYGLLGACMIL